MRTRILAILAFLTLLTAGVAAQGPGAGMTLVCSTTDGTVVINQQTISLADYQLRFDQVVADGVIRFHDTANNISAVLDTRDSEGLYLLVEDSGVRMQLVASRKNIQFREVKEGSEPGAPTWSMLSRYLPSNDTKK